MEGSGEVTTVRWSPAGPAASATVLECAGGSHVGQVRELNEDALLIGPPVLVVADGMGGHARGDVASTLVVEAFAPLRGSAATTPADVEQALARSRVMIAAIESEDGADPGATVVSASYVEEAGRGYWLIAHVGDARAYSWRAGELDQLTRDHSLVQELVEAGRIDATEADSHPERHVVTRAIGAIGNAQADYTLVPLETDQRLLLCSDGLSGELSDKAIGTILGQGGTPGETVASLLEAAVNMGGRDNVTAVVVDVVDVSPLPAPREDTMPMTRTP